LTNLKILYDRVMVFRAYMDANTDWKTPSVIDCLRFAVCEAAESLDAWLREKGGYARNRENGHTVHSELAQCALMLLTALGEIGVGFQPKKSIPVDLDTIVVETAAALAQANAGTWHWPVLRCLRGIAAYPGMDLAVELDKAMEQIRRKHDVRHCTQRLPAAEATWDSGHSADEQAQRWAGSGMEESD